MRYPFHPAYGEELIVVRRYRKQPLVCVRLPDGTHANLPCWMFDPGAAGHAPLVEEARVSLAGLLELRRLVDGFAGCSDGGEPHAHDPEQTTTKT